MKALISVQIVMIFVCSLLALPAYAQNDSRQWMNLNGNVKSLRQVKYMVTSNSLIEERSEQRRLRDVFLMRFGNQSYLDNSMVTFSKEGRILEWLEFDTEERVRTKLDAKYASYNLPEKLFVMSGMDTILQIVFSFNESGKHHSVQIQNTTSIFLNDNTLKLYSDSVHFGDDISVYIYRFNKKGAVEMDLFQNNEFWQTMAFKLNKQGDFTQYSAFRFLYEFDKHSNWIIKTVILDGKPIEKFVRKIEYY